MALTQEFLDTLNVMADCSPGPRCRQWPTPKNAGGFLEFRNFADWRDFFLAFRLADGVPLNMADAFHRALKIAILSWIDDDLYVAAEMAALSALEHSLRDCYLGDEKQRRLKRAAERARQKDGTLTEEDNEKAGRVLFTDLLSIMVREEKLTDDTIPIARKCGLKIMPVLTGKTRVVNGDKEQDVPYYPSLADMRNIRAHGNPFDSAPTAGLIELIRDLIEIAYRPRIEEAERIRSAHRSQ